MNGWALSLPPSSERAHTHVHVCGLPECAHIHVHVCSLPDPQGHVRAFQNPPWSPSLARLLCPN